MLRIARHQPVQPCRRSRYVGGRLGGHRGLRQVEGEGDQLRGVLPLEHRVAGEICARDLGTALVQHPVAEAERQIGAALGVVIRLRHVRRAALAEILHPALSAIARVDHLDLDVAVARPGL